jgi:tetratricopeptide (TPR) repeat protein
MGMKVCEGALIFLLGLGAFAANAVAPAKAELEAMYAAAAREVNAGNYTDALQKLDAIDARQPEMAAAQNLRGVALMRLGEYGRAETALRKAREIDPEFWEARFNLAEVPFLRKSWAEARHRFEALADAKTEQAEGVTGELIQFKILLTYLLEGKEKKANGILDQLQTSSVSPAYYCGKAALAFRHRNETEAKVALKAAEKSFSPRLNKLFVESFYAIGWMAKPDGAVPAALEVDSLAERVARAQADFRKAERAYRHGDYEGALQSLDRLDATAPNQAVSYNLRGKVLLAQGKDSAAEAALRNALVADPQFEEARYNLARIPFRGRDYEAARKQFEALLGATSGGRQSRQREQLIQYQIFLTLLLEGRDGPAQKAMDEFKMMDDTPALYYAQAAWAFRHGNVKQGNAWVANAGNLFPEDLSQAFAAPFADLGWLSKAGAPATATQASLASGPNPTPQGTVVSRDQPPNARSLVASPPEIPVAITPAPTAPLAETPAVLAQTDESKAAPTPAPSAAPEKTANVKKSNSRKRSTARTERNLKSIAGESAESARSDRKSSRTGARKPAEAAKLEASREFPAQKPTPGTAEGAEPPRQNFGDKVARFFSYPFRTRNDKPPRPAGADSRESKSPSPQPARPKN